MHVSSIPMHLFTLTVPSTMSYFTMSHAARDPDLQKMLHCQIHALRLELFSSKPPHIRVNLVANRHEVLSRLTIIFSHILQFLLVCRLWTLVIIRFMNHECFAGPETELQAPATHF